MIAVEGISLLLFSRNDIKKALMLVKDMYGCSDEIILCDSSDRKEHAKLLSETKRLKLNKLRVFYTVPLGYLEPTLMYALKKSRYRWCILLGTDERISPRLKIDLHKLINDYKCSSFSIRRFEDVSGNKKGAYTNWQTRLFRKDSISFRGIIHEEPVVSGTTIKLTDANYFIDHVNELKGDSSKGYSRMERFLRMSYKSFNERLIDYFYKITVPKKHNAPGAFGGSLMSLLLIYERLGNKHLEDEISDFDYFVFYYLYSLATSFKMRRPGAFINAFRDGKQMLGKVREWQAAPDGDMEFEISKILYKKGLIKFLELDKDETIKRINNKYANRDGGIDLLISLLKLRYKKGERWLD